jgi:hypothetical protein
MEINHIVDTIALFLNLISIIHQTSLWILQNFVFCDCYFRERIHWCFNQPTCKDKSVNFCLGLQPDEEERIRTIGIVGSVMILTACLEHNVIFTSFYRSIALFPPWSYLLVTTALYSLVGLILAHFYGLIGYPLKLNESNEFVKWPWKEDSVRSVHRGCCSWFSGIRHSFLPLMGTSLISLLYGKLLL